MNATLDGALEADGAFLRGLPAATGVDSTRRHLNVHEGHDAGNAMARKLCGRPAKLDDRKPCAPFSKGQKYDEKAD